MIAIEISSIIPGCRAFSSAQPPARNGQPPHQNTIEPSTGPSQLMPGKSSSYPNQSMTISLVTTRGIVRARLSQNRCRKTAGS